MVVVHKEKPRRPTERRLQFDFERLDTFPLTSRTTTDRRIVFGNATPTPNARSNAIRGATAASLRINLATARLYCYPYKSTKTHRSKAASPEEPMRGHPHPSVDRLDLEYAVPDNMVGKETNKQADGRTPWQDGRFQK